MPEPSPPASWERKGPKSAVTRLSVTVDKKGKVHDPLVIQSGGADVDKKAIEAVRTWRFKPARCGTAPIETKVQVNVTIGLQ
jgi:TonB family protein